ncbi:hypothetical protein KY345_00755, partial [Candidatus Woesearchaeota archaeon]|nr:hypothetical protein [Candidatus Woesearchaeota archaeon]
DGTIDIAWYDRRNDPFDLDWDVYFTSSSDGGSTFSPNVKISDISFATPTAPWGEKWMGEYLGLVVDSQYAYIGFTSNKTDLRGDIYADSIMNPSACPGGMKGNGTASYPCNITTCDELNRIRDNLTLYYILGNDIDFSDAGCSAYTTGGGFAPIGTFTGTFDGQNHTITGLYINRTTSYIGLFSNNGALIKNLGLVDINVTGYRYVGGLAGYNGGTVSNSYASGAVTGYRDVGRLVGRNYRGTVSNSYATGTVIGHITIGGLVGDNNHGNVINSYATGTVTGTGGSSVGGLVGMSSNYGTVSNSYATGIVTGASNVGGLLGYNVGSVTISNSYAAGTVTGSQSVGGLAGYNGGTISNSYATGSVTGTGNNVGGLVGYHYRGTISNSYATGPVTGSGSEIGGLAGYKDISATISTSYWDVCRTNQSNCTGSGTPANCYGRSFSSYFYDVSNAPMSSWDFTNVWDNSCDDDGYPILQSLDGQSCQSAGTTMKGTGTISDPFNITTCCQLQAMQDNLTAYYILVNDIDCSATNTWSWDGSKYLGFKPVGTSSTQFTGTLDGQGNTITGLYINRPSTIGVGLFGSTNRAIINNVSLKDINITGNNNVGGLAGYISTYSSITYSYANGTVTGNDNVGGLAGALSESSLSSSYSTCTVTGYNALGGLVGFVGVSNIDNSYSTGTVTGNDYVGGLAGTLGDYGSIDNSYSTGTVTANNYVGGLAGRLLDRSHASINDSYSTGTVTGTGNNVSGLVGYLGSTSSIYNSYWDVCRTNQSSCTGNAGTPANCYGKNNQTHQDTDYFYTKTNPPMDVWSNSVWNKTSCPGGYILLLNLAGTCNSNPDPCPCAQCQPPYPQGLLPYCDNNNCPPPDYVCSNPVYGCINDDPDYCGYGYTCDYVGGPAIVPEFSIINIILAIAIVGLGIILIVRKKKK